jgi:hypothetical protein
MTDNHFLESGEATFFSSQLLSSFQIITSQNQPIITYPEKTSFDRAPLILPENQELGVVPNCPLIPSQTHVDQEY